MPNLTEKQRVEYYQMMCNIHAKYAYMNMSWIKVYERMGISKNFGAYIRSRYKGKK